MATNPSTYKQTNYFSVISLTEPPKIVSSWFFSKYDAKLFAEKLVLETGSKHAIIQAIEVFELKREVSSSDFQSLKKAISDV
jgi:hypothetical protein